MTVKDTGRHSASLVLVVIADPKLRQTVGWSLGELELPYLLVSNWREAVVHVSVPLVLTICDLDDQIGSYERVARFAQTGWGEPVPLIVLSSAPDVEGVASGLGAIAGLHKPVSAMKLMSAIHTAARQ